MGRERYTSPPSKRASLVLTTAAAQITQIYNQSMSRGPPILICGLPISTLFARANMASPATVFHLTFHSLSQLWSIWNPTYFYVVMHGPSGRKKKGNVLVQCSSNRIEG